jgi:8-oxo-dGTP diphosphatase
MELEATDAAGYRQAQQDPKPEPSRAGGVVYRRNRQLMMTKKQVGREYLIVQANEKRDEWVLPKGHIEPHEDMTETAVREVVEETGIWARIERDLGTISFNLTSEAVQVQFYLMEAMACDRPEEKREIEWRAIDAAIDLVTHEQSKDLLRRVKETSSDRTS